MANEPWSQEAELELLAIEAALIARAGLPSPLVPGAGVAEFRALSPQNTMPLSVSQEIEAMQSLPWSEEEERAVRQVEDAVYGVARPTSAVSVSDTERDNGRC